MNSHLNALRCTIVGSTNAPDRLLASGSICHATAIDQPPVLLTYLFEVTKPWFPESRLIPSLIDTLNTEYPSLSGDENLGNHFEALLKRVNQQLNQISESGETDWIGSINGLISCVFEDQLLFSQTGSCPTYLLQRNRIRQITEEPSDEQAHPLKTFANLASGTLQAEDRILIANRELYREISLDALRRVVSNATPYHACQQIVRELKQNRNTAITVSILHINTAASPAIPEPQDILLDDVFEHKVKKLQRKAAPAVKAALSSAQSGIKIADRVTREQLLPRGQQLVQHGHLLVKTWQAHYSRAHNATCIEIISPSSHIVPLPSTTISENVRQWWSKISNRKGVALALTVTLITITVISLASRLRHTPSDTANSASQLKKAQSLSDQAATAIQQQQDSAALQDIAQSRTLINKLTGTEVDTLIGRLDTQQDTVTHTTRLVAGATFALSNPASQLLYNRPFIYAGSGTTVLRIDENHPSAPSVMTLPSPDDTIVSLANNPGGPGAGFVLTENSHVYQIIQTNNSSSLSLITPADGQFKQGVTFTSYNGNLYILDGKIGQLWRYTDTGTAYSRAVSSLNSMKYDLKNSISVAIDGSIYLLTTNGSVQKYTAGQPDPGFAIRNLPPSYQPLTRAVQIFTDIDATNLYVLDAGISNTPSAKLIALSKEGTFVQAFGFPKDCTDVRAVSLDLANKTVWLLDGSTIKKFQLP